MTLTIELTPEQAARLAAAAREKGAAPEEYAHQLLAEHLPPIPPDETEQDPTLALFARWEQEDAHMTPEEIEQERKLWEEFERDINATRQAMGMRLL